MTLFENYKLQENIFFRNTIFNSYIEVFDFINEKIGNPLHKNIKLRNYQKEALGLFFYHYEKDKKQMPIHLLFNLATGSGKTVLMAYAIYYLHKNGYSNFVFLVNSTSILTKTIDNFVNLSSEKYLFKENLDLEIRETDSFFEKFFNNIINIKFTTIQGLSSEIYTKKENAINLEDLQNNKIVMLADESHHLNSSTKSDREIKKDNKSWENCVISLLEANKDNLLLEFTATIGNDLNVLKKYEKKIIYKYDLKNFREDRYTKEIELAQLSDNENDHYKDRIILSILNNIYRQKLFEEIKHSVTPVILFKSNTTTQNSINHQRFLEQIKKMSHFEIQRFFEKYINKKNKSDLCVQMENILDLFDSYENIVIFIKNLFNENTVKIVDSENSKNEDLSFLNKLDSDKNQIRAIFQVDMLNEGWDVLSLFDIVRLHDGRSNVTNKKTGQIEVGKQTIREAQLIGRGARYFPFSFGDKENKGKRKFDSDIENKYRILETMFYYSGNDNLYISELKSTMKKEGIISDKDSKEIKLKLKEKTIERAKNEEIHLFVNNIEKSNLKTTIKEIKDDASNYREIFEDINIYSSVNAFEDLNEHKDEQEIEIKTYEGTLKEHGFKKGLIYKSLRRNSFFRFNNLERYIKDINSIRELINIIENITLTIYTNNNLNENEKLKILENINTRIKKFIEKNTINKKSKEFKKINLLDIFSEEKTIRVDKKMEEKINNEEWFSHESFCGTKLEHDFINEFGHQLQNKDFSIYENHLLIRNERELTIYNEEGRAFQPDFIWLFKKHNKHAFYQVFIEPKGEHLIEKDSWKEEFLKSINKKIESDNFVFHILGTKFFEENDNKNYWVFIKNNI